MDEVVNVGEPEIVNRINVRVEHGTQLPFTPEQPFHLILEDITTKERFTVPLNWAGLQAVSMATADAVAAVNARIDEAASRLRSSDVQPRRVI